MVTSAATPYELLEVHQDASDNDLSKAYRTHIHALKDGELSSSAFRRICRAFETLSDHGKRNLYDTRQEWISQLPIEKYTLQQLAAEPALFPQLKERLRNATLREINAQDPLTGHTPLYCAARVGSAEAVSYLTEQGAEPDLPQRTNSTALHVASFYGHANVIRTLLESGANYQNTNTYNNTPKEEAFDESVTNVFNDLKESPYVQAAANELVSFSQHVDEQYYAQRQTLLHCASKKGYFDLVRRLVEQHQANFDIVDINENSALHLAAYGGHASIVEYLLNRGANSILVNRWGMTAEEEGAIHENKITDIFQRMRTRDMFEMARDGIDWWFKYYFGATSPDAVDGRGTSLLYHACRYEQISVAKWLLEHGANVNIQLAVDPRSTVLHGASYNGYVSTVELLLAYGADVSIKNDYNATALDEASTDEARHVLLQHRQNVLENKLIDVEIFSENSNKRQKIAQVQLHCDSIRDDLLTALPATLRYQAADFSIAGRPLHFNRETSSVISAVCSSRYVDSRFVEVPLRLTLHTTPLTEVSSGLHHADTRFDLRMFNPTFHTQSRRSHLNLKVDTNNKQIHHVDGITFSFAAGCTNENLSIEIRTLVSPELNFFKLPNCVCLFETLFNDHTDKLRELPIVSFANEPTVRLYTLAKPSSLWFTAYTRHTRLPMLNGLHAFVRHVPIIPPLLSLPADMFMQTVAGQPLISRQNPVRCTCLTLRRQNSSQFPHIAYHGTSLEAVRSIITDGLVLPGTLVSNGTRVSPRANRVPRESAVFDSTDFANAIFLSPSVHYSSDQTHATPFTHEDQQLVPVLECSVKRNAFSIHRGTIPTYTVQPDDDINTIDWRVRDPTSIEINAVLFIPVVASVTAAKRARAIKMGTDT